jgi:hypothetical protein
MAPKVSRFPDTLAGGDIAPAANIPDDARDMIPGIDNQVVK